MGFFTRLVKNGDGTFTERYRGGTTYVYAAPDARGMSHMTQLADRHGNKMRFEYNPHEQLVRVIDTLGRPIVYRYNAQRRLSEVEDFSGRKLRFEYDANGDLVAVTSPAVTGTPNGNDFPNGKTTRYRYSTGFADERLNHNMTEVIAPNEVAVGGPARVKLEYDNDPASPNVDRVLRQVFGGTNASGIPAGGTITYEYHALAGDPALGHNASVSQTSVTNRNGNYTEYQYNHMGDFVRIRKFANRKIRPGDPEFFETRYEHNMDMQLVRVVLPEGNSTEFIYDEKNPDRFQQGNLLAEIRRPDAKRGGDQEAIKTTYTYEPIYNQRRTVTEPRGNDAIYVPQNGGANSLERYTTVNIFDYQKGRDFASLGKILGVSADDVKALLARANIPMGLGDVNGDKRSGGVAGDIVKTVRPSVTLLPDSNVARIEGGTRQPIEESFTYNPFGQMTSKRDAEGNVTLYYYHPANDPGGSGRDLTSGRDANPSGYLKETIRDAEANPIRNSRTDPLPAKIRHRYFYDDVGNVIREIDGRGIATEYSVNQLNQVVQTIRAADVSKALQNPKEPKWEAANDPTLIECSHGMVAFKYRTRVAYDSNGNVIKREVENRDSNNQDLAGAWIATETKYDILDHRIEESHENRKDRPEVAIAKYRYDRNGNPVIEFSPLANLPVGDLSRQPANVVSYVFDERDLLYTSTRGGLTDQFKAIKANGDIPETMRVPNSPDISTFARRYDGNLNVVEQTDAADKIGSGKPQSTLTLFDGFDRQISVIDAAGNQRYVQYDPVGNDVRISRFGSVGGPTPHDRAAATVQQPLHLQDFAQPLLSQVEIRYDEHGREYERADKLFIYSGVEYKRKPVLRNGPLGSTNDGWVRTRTEFDRASRTIFSIRDNLATNRRFYDGAGRGIRTVDAELNEVDTVYDENSNEVRITRIEVTQRDKVREGKVPDLRETFTRLNIYDSLNRRIRTTDNMGDTTRYRYDSRGNMISTSDAQYSNDPRDLIEDPLGVFPGKDPDARRVTRINRPGNTNEFFYDGLDRRVAEIRQLRVSGQGKNQIDLTNPVNPDGVILTSYLWDVNNRLVAMADDGCTLDNQNTDNTGVATVNPKGNVTRYEYDALNRQTREVSSDGSSSTVTYDADDDPVRSEDANGSTVNTSFDVIKRVLKKEVNRGKQVVGTTLQEFSYDGLSRLTRSFDNNDPDDPAEAATVIFAYDSLSRLLEEVQNGHVVSGIWDGANDRIGLIYPNGRQIEMSFDKLDRINAIKDQGATKDIAGYSYIGPERVLERNYANGVRMTYLDDSRREDIGYDGIGRPIVLRHLRSDNSPVLGFAQTFDRMKNKLSEKKLHNPANSELYAYDSASRLVDFQRGALDAGNEAIAKPSADSLQRERWTLDGVGNWQQMLLVNGGNSISESRQHSSLNEMTQRKRGSALSTILFDRNGNVTDDGTYLFTWDFKNRLRTASRKSDRAVIGVYSYDAFGRRIRKVVTNAGALNSITNFYLDGGQEIEERDKADAPSQQYVYGHYLDEPLVLDRNLRGHTSAFGNGDQRLFYHQNTLLSVFALTDSSGRVVEGYQYDAYGRQTVLRSAVVNGLLEFARDHLATVGGFSGKGNPFMFTGRRLDAEIGMYYYRTRYLDPLMGRFTSRDAFGTWADIGNFGNAYSYVGNRPTVKVDPRGAFGDDVAPPASGSTTTGPPTTPGCKLVPNIWWANTCTVGGCTGGGKCEGTEWQLKFFRKVLVSEGNYTPNHADDYEPTACGCKNNTPELCPAPTPAPPPPDRFDLGPALELMTEWGLYPGVLLEGYSEHYHGKGMVGGGEEEYDIPFPQPGPYGGYNGWGPRWGPPARNQWQETFGD